MNESYSLDRIIMREWLASRGTGGLVILSAAVTYSRTWVFCFWITWYRVGFSSRVSTWSTFLGRSMSMFSSGSFTEKTDGDGEGLLSYALSCSRSSCCLSWVREEEFRCGKLV
uniref:(northern house mosquito) hypothetical protein n=1 Tax=Culex pipiens TaxID=7175 RepID=A0A8D8PI99_CULPI